MKGSSKLKKGLRKTSGNNPMSIDRRVIKQSTEICHKDSLAFIETAGDGEFGSVVSKVCIRRRIKSAIPATPKPIKGV